jgi:hypothetical protein
MSKLSPELCKLHNFGSPVPKSWFVIAQVSFIVRETLPDPMKDFCSMFMHTFMPQSGSIVCMSVSTDGGGLAFSAVPLLTAAKKESGMDTVKP